MYAPNRADDLEGKIETILVAAAPQFKSLGGVPDAIWFQLWPLRLESEPFSFAVGKFSWVSDYVVNGELISLAGAGTRILILGWDPSYTIVFRLDIRQDGPLNGDGKWKPFKPHLGLCDFECFTVLVT